MAERWYIILAKNGTKVAVRGARQAEEHARIVEGRVLGRVRREDLV